MTRSSGGVEVERGGAVRRRLEQQLAACLVLGLTALEIAHPTSIRETFEIAVASLGVWAAGRTIGHARERVADDAFVGRRDELGVLLARLEDARRGQPRFLLVEGPAGIGKTALLDRFQAELEGARVLRATADPAEERVPFGVVDQLLRLAGAREPGVLGADDGEHVDVGLRLLELFGELQDASPVAVVVDDAHWADEASLNALLFAARRLTAERVLVALAVREEDEAQLPEGVGRIVDGPTGTRLRVGPLAPYELQALGATAGHELSARAARRLHETTGGNPSYARALLDELTPAEWAGVERPLPAPRSFAVHVRDRLAACSQQTRRLLEAVSVLGPGCSLAGAAPLAGLDCPLDALEEGSSAGLLQQDAGGAANGVSFSHPLVQGAVYHELGPARRARLHAAAADLVDDEEQALWHRIAAVPGADPALAAEIDDVAARDAERGAWASVAMQLVAASRLSASGRDRERRLLAAADAMATAGQADEARAFADELGDASGPLADAVHGHLALVAHRPEAETLLRSAWQGCEPLGDARLCALVALNTARYGLVRLRGGDVVRWSRRALELAPADAGRAHVAHALGLAYSGRLDEGRAVLDGAAARTGDLALTTAQGLLRLVDDDPEGARTDLADAAPRALRRGALDTAALGFAQLARADYATGDWGDAVLHAERALDTAAELDHLSIRAHAHGAAMLVPAARGDWAAAQEHAVALAAHVTVFEEYTATAGVALAQLAAARSEPDGVLRALEPIRAIGVRDGIDEPGFWPWPHLAGDALVALGRLDEADVLLREHEARAADRGRRSAIARLGRVRGRLEAARGNGAGATAAFRTALDALEGLPLPYERALVELRLGEFLRREGQRRAAAARLGSARDVLAELGAVPALERCEREFVACGLTPVKRNGCEQATLTPQEGAVARLVAQGLTNREVASELTVSVKTVEFHLTRVYAKLGVRSRAQLRARARAGDAELAP